MIVVKTSSISQDLYQIDRFFTKRGVGGRERG